MFRYLREFLQIPLQVLIALDVDENEIRIVVDDVMIMHDEGH